ncbi:serine/threonine protein kinase [Spirillospora sp. NBC_00431]
MSPSPTIPGYRLDQEIGHGGMGVVYRAERLGDGVPVAVKVMRPGLGDDPGRRDRLRAEAERAAAFSHPAIVDVLDVGERDDLIWIVMELVDGPDLQRLVKDRGPLPPALAADLVAQIADALIDVHGAGFVHRDIKPANILVEHFPEQFPENSPEPESPGERPTARLADFGIAHALISEDDVGLSDASAWTRSTTGDAAIGAGTLAYMAPEQWNGDRKLTARTDVYAVGATLFTLLTGRLPFQQVTFLDLAREVAMSAPPVPSELAKEIPTAFDSVVARAMAKDPADRYADTADLARAVRAAARGEPDPRTPVTPASGRRRRTLTLAGSAAGLVVAVGAVTLWAPWSSEGDSSESDEAHTLRRTVCARDLSVRDHPGGKILDQLPRGTKVTAYPDRGHGFWWYVRADNGASGWAQNQHLAASCPPR